MNAFEVINQTIEEKYLPLQKEVSEVLEELKLKNDRRILLEVERALNGLSDKFKDMRRLMKWKERIDEFKESYYPSFAEFMKKFPSRNFSVTIAFENTCYDEHPEDDIETAYVDGKGEFDVIHYILKELRIHKIVKIEVEDDTLTILQNYEFVSSQIIIKPI